MKNFSFQKKKKKGGRNILCVVDRSTNRLFTISGGNANFVENGTATNVQLTLVFGITFDFQGNVFFSDSSANSIKKFNITSGTLTTVVSTVPAIRSVIFSPDYLSLYFSSNSANRIYRLQGGNLLPYAGTSSGKFFFFFFAFLFLFLFFIFIFIFLKKRTNFW